MSSEFEHSSDEDFTRLLRSSTVEDVPDPGADFEARMWRRIEPELRRPQAQPVWSTRNVAMVVGWAAMIALIVVTGSRRLGTGPAPTPAASGSATADVREQVLFTALGTHLGQTEVLLVELLNAPETPSAMTIERQMADDLVNSGRLYRLTAEETGHGLFSAVLDDVEPVLVEVARAPDVVPSSDLAALRERIVEGDLLFKVRAAARGARNRQGAGEL